MQPVTQGTVLENGTATLLARLRHWDGTLVTQADVSAIEYTAYALGATEDDRTAIDGHAAISIPVATGIFDALQTDDRWDRDATGYNFRHTIDISTSPLATVAGSRILVAVALTPISGQPIRWDYLLSVL